MYKTISHLIIVGFLFFSCNNVPEKNAKASTNDCTEYACPMHPDHTSVSTPYIGTV